MVRHMVMWKLKPEAVATPKIYAENMDILRGRFESMKKELSIIKNLEVHESFKTGEGFFDFIVIMDFESREDLEHFQVSPTHQDPDAKLFYMSIRQQKSVVDYEYYNK